MLRPALPRGRRAALHLPRRRERHRGGGGHRGEPAVRNLGALVGGAVAGVQGQKRDKQVAEALAKQQGLTVEERLKLNPLSKSLPKRGAAGLRREPLERHVPRDRGRPAARAGDDRAAQGGALGLVREARAQRPRSPSACPGGPRRCCGSRRCSWCCSTRWWRCRGRCASTATSAR